MWFSDAIGDNVLLAAAPPHLMHGKRDGIGSIAIRGPGSLLHQVESVPISAEILHLARGQLESGAELAVLEEDVRIPEAGRVEVFPLPLLREDALDALDQADFFQDSYLTVACRDRDTVPLADLLGTDLPLVRGEEDLRAVFVREQLGRFEGAEQPRGIRKSVVVSVHVVLHVEHPETLYLSMKLQDI